MAVRLWQTAAYVALHIRATARNETRHDDAKDKGDGGCRRCHAGGCFGGLRAAGWTADPVAQ